MSDETIVRELTQKVDRLEEEQQRLKADQQKKTANGANGSDKKPGQESGSEQKAQEQPEKPKKPFAQRARGYVKQHPGLVLLGAIALVLLVVGGALLYAYFSSYE